MTKKWEKLEDDCFNRLKTKYGKNNTFEKCGQSDSTISDIKVKSKNSLPFFIEVKSPKSQAGQFVLQENKAEQSFEFSTKNATEKSPEAQKMIDDMNKGYDTFASPTTKGIPLNTEENVLYSHIKQYYLKKGARYFITKNDDYIIFPIESLENYFDVSAKFRIKKSGSAHLPKSDKDELKKCLENDNIYGDITYVGVKAYFEPTDNQTLDKIKFKNGEKEFLFKKEQNPPRYLIRKLSNTNNASVTLSLKLKKTAKQDKQDLDKFEKEIGYQKD